MNENRLIRLQKSIDAMGSTYSVVLYGRDERAMEDAIGAAFDEVARLDELLSNYKPHSQWSLVNRHAAERPVSLSDELYQLICQCLEYSRQSDGAFDISVSPLTKAWGFYKDNGRLPGAAEAACAHRRVGYRYIHLDPAASTIRFEHPGLEIDPGGIGKGYTVDRMAAIFRQREFTTCLLAASHSTIYGMGAPPTEPRGWPVTIRNPVDQREPLAEVFLNDISLSTSGSGEKSFMAGGKTYSHIMDPRTGQPANGTLVSVMAPRNIDTEAWTKARLVNGRDWLASHPLEGARVYFWDRDCAT